MTYDRIMVLIIVPFRDGTWKWKLKEFKFEGSEERLGDLYLDDPELERWVNHKTNKWFYHGGEVDANKSSCVYPMIYNHWGVEPGDQFDFYVRDDFPESLELK